MTQFTECHLADRQYHDADEVWEDLKVGTKLQLVRDLDNRFDSEAHYERQVYLSIRIERCEKQDT